MTFADGIADPAGNQAVPIQHGLLGTTGQWHLPLGVTQAIPLRWAARALLALATAVLLAWAASLFAQAWSSQEAWSEPVLAMAVGLPWWWMAFQLWRRLAQSTWVPLHWGGLPSCRPGHDPMVVSPGWSVPGWPHAVSVHVVFELGPWVLVKMGPVARGFHPQAWFWVDARVGLQGTAGHHLRALLFSSRANAVGLDRPLSAEGPVVVASSVDIQRQWSNLLSSFKTIGHDVGISAVRRDAHARRMAMPHSDFAPTAILEFPSANHRGGRS
ncbi:hypothetical protein [Aquabacterium sp.]|uniref:hypothetical protein n=1 Tax=Aquabacterium sp. TaxID=1872578 RepID=UPI003D6D9D86